MFGLPKEDFLDVEGGELARMVEGDPDDQSRRYWARERIEIAEGNWKGLRRQQYLNMVIRIDPQLLVESYFSNHTIDPCQRGILKSQINKVRSRQRGD